MLTVDSVSELSRDIVFGQQCPRVSRRLHRAQRSLAATLPLSRASFAYLVASCTLPSKWWVCTPVAFAPVPISTFHRSSQSHGWNRVCHFCCRPKFQRVQTPTYIHTYIAMAGTGTAVSVLEGKTRAQVFQGRQVWARRLAIRRKAAAAHKTSTYAWRAFLALRHRLSATA